MVEDNVRGSEFTEPLKTMMATSIDTISYKGMEIVRIRIPRQTTVSFVGNNAFLRIGSATHQATGPQIAALTAKFQRG